MRFLLVSIAPQHDGNALFRETGYGRDRAQPALGRPTPDLNPGRQLVALPDRADAQRHAGGIAIGRAGMDGRAAGLAEGLAARLPALRGLDVKARRAREQAEAARLGQNGGAKGRARERLAIRAMTNRHPRRVHLGLIADRATVTGPVHTHRLTLGRGKGVAVDRQPAIHRQDNTRDKSRLIRSEIQRRVGDELRLTGERQRLHSGPAILGQHVLTQIVLVPQRFVDASWEHIETLSNYIVEVVAYEDKPHQWQAFLLNGVVGQGIQDEIPQNFVDVISSLPDLAGEYRFPWMARQGWWAVQGWHGGNAIDFQPAYEVGYSVVAVESGYLREVCRDGYQSLLQITHADGNVTYYLHVQPSRTLRNTLLDHSVQRGQYLGELTRNPPFNYACGQGLSRHLHFVSSNPHLIIQGHDLSNIAEIATCCRDVPIFVSENERVN